MNRADLPELLKFWRTLPAPSNEVAAADIIGELLAELRQAENQRSDFRRQLTAEREGRMLAERIVDEVRALNRDIEEHRSHLQEALLVANDILRSCYAVAERCAIAELPGANWNALHEQINKALNAQFEILKPALEARARKSSNG